MNNKPVAWIANDADLPLKEDGSYWLYPENPSKDNLYIPLYTHPAELTDEEIKEIVIKHQGTWDEDTFLCLDYRSFARAILRKAQ